MKIIRKNNQIKKFFTQKRHLNDESRLIRYLLILFAISVITIFILLPISIIFTKALSQGITYYLQALRDNEALHSFKLTFIVILVAVPLNLVFGVCAAWCISKFNFKGKDLLKISLSLPLAVSPIIAGLIYILLFSPKHFLGKWLEKHDIEILFATGGLIIATVFVTLPFIAKELITNLEASGNDQEEAAILLGATPLQIFRHITLPNVKLSLIYGVLISVARALGEFGAVSVISGHIRGKTLTVPLYIETLYDEHNFVAAFAVASILTILAFVTLIIKSRYTTQATALIK